MARIKVNDDNTWVQIFPGDPSWSNGEEVKITVVDSGAGTAENPYKGGSVIKDKAGKVTVDTTAAKLFGIEESSDPQMQDLGSYAYEGETEANPMGATGVTEAVPDELKAFDLRTGYSDSGGDDSVREVQQQLLDAGFDIGDTEADGKWGPDSQAGWDAYEAERNSIIEAGDNAIQPPAGFNPNVPPPSILGAPGLGEGPKNNSRLNDSQYQSLQTQIRALQSGTELAALKKTTEARSVFKTLLTNFGIAADIKDATTGLTLIEFLDQEIIDGASEITITQKLREHSAYAARFPYMTTRRENGYNAISEYEGLALEDSIQSLAREYGIDATLFDTPAEVAEIIANDISVIELGTRFAAAAEAASYADTEISNQLLIQHGINQNDLIAYYLDPEKTVNSLTVQNEMNTAKIGAGAKAAFGTATGKSISQQLSDIDIQAREVQAMGSKKGLLQTIGNESSLSVDSLAEGIWSLDDQAVNAIDKRLNNRTSRFRGTGSLAGGAAGISGFGTAT